MSARNELADIFTGHQVSFGAFPKRLMRGHAQEIAEKVLAAGYRRPQQVTILAELDALPLESVIKASDGNVWESLVGGWFETASRTPHLAGDIALPAMVLHVGGTSV